MKTIKLGLMACTALIIGFASCKKDDPKEIKETKITKTDSVRVTTNARSGQFTLYSLKEGKIIDQKDSATDKWDFGIRFVDIIVNGHSSGPGNTAVITEKGVYGNYMKAPATGYAYDTTTNQRAINSSLTNGWYNYDRATHDFDPKAGMFFVFKTTDNKYAKVEMLTGRYEDFTGPMPLWIVHKFRYTYQEDGSTNF